MARVTDRAGQKAKLSEILKKVRAGQRVGISYRGELVAEVAPVEPRAGDARPEVETARSAGSHRAGEETGKPFPRIARRPGALKRFLASRD